MTAVIGMRELVRNSKLLENYDYVEIEDKKTHEYKGLFISPKYAKEFKELLEKKISDEKQKDLDEIMQFAGSFDGEFTDLTTNEKIREKSYSNRAKKYEQ
ncbi:MAG: hypothetical protein JXQ66_07720 [Campylobacterales bacterium]|nr:hypothetical protein [Campylobacterales bacterium]